MLQENDNKIRDNLLRDTHSFLTHLCKVQRNKTQQN